MTIIIRVLTIFLLTGLLEAEAAECPYPLKAVNWINRYCAMKAQSDDETVIQRSPCFKETKKDINAGDQCKMKEKYKTKICEEFLMETKQFKSISDCVKNSDVAPFIPG